MIHSLAGGKLKDLDFADFAKVQLITDEPDKILWYITDILDLNIGDIVLVPVGINNALEQATVLKIERNVSSHVAPIPIKRAKLIYKKIEK